MLRVNNLSLYENISYQRSVRHHSKNREYDLPVFRRILATGAACTEGF